MDLKQYIDKRKLEMIAESQQLGKRRGIIIQQGQSLQNELNALTAKLGRLDVELEVLAELRQKEEQDAGVEHTNSEG